MKTQTDVIISCSKDSFVKFWDLNSSESEQAKEKLLQGMTVQ